MNIHPYRSITKNRELFYRALSYSVSKLRFLIVVCLIYGDAAQKARPDDTKKLDTTKQGALHPKTKPGRDDKAALKEIRESVREERREMKAKQKETYRDEVNDAKQELKDLQYKIAQEIRQERGKPR